MCSHGFYFGGGGAYLSVMENKQLPSAAITMGLVFCPNGQHISLIIAIMKAPFLSSSIINSWPVCLPVECCIVTANDTSQLQLESETGAFILLWRGTGTVPRRTAVQWKQGKN